MQALEDLDYLAALDNYGNLSEIGIIMSEFPLDPQLSKSILASYEFNCVDEMLTIAAMVTGILLHGTCAYCSGPIRAYFKIQNYCARKNIPIKLFRGYLNFVYSK